MIYQKPHHYFLGISQMNVQLQGTGQEINPVCSGNCSLPNDGGIAVLGYNCLNSETVSFQFALGNTSCSEFSSDIPPCQVAFVDGNVREDIVLEQDCVAEDPCTDSEACGPVFRVTCTKPGASFVCGAGNNVTLTCGGVSEPCLIPPG